jgi:hypothetical protein
MYSHCFALQLVIVVSCLGKAGTPARLQQIGLCIDVELRTGRYCILGRLMKRKVDGVSIREAQQGVMQKRDDRQARRLAQKLRRSDVGRGAPEKASSSSAGESGDVQGTGKCVSHPWPRGLAFTNDAVFELQSLKVMANPAFAEALVM